MTVVVASLCGDGRMINSIFIVWPRAWESMLWHRCKETIDTIKLESEVQTDLTATVRYLQRRDRFRQVERTSLLAPICLSKQSNSQINNYSEIRKKTNYEKSMGEQLQKNALNKLTILPSAFFIKSLFNKAGWTARREKQIKESIIAQFQLPVLWRIRKKDRRRFKIHKSALVVLSTHLLDLEATKDDVEVNPRSLVSYPYWQIERQKKTRAVDIIQRPRPTVTVAFGFISLKGVSMRLII